MIVTFESIVKAIQKYKGNLVRRSVASWSIHTANDILAKKQEPIASVPDASRYLSSKRLFEGERSERESVFDTSKPSLTARVTVEALTIANIYQTVRASAPMVKESKIDLGYYHEYIRYG